MGHLDGAKTVSTMESQMYIRTERLVLVAVRVAVFVFVLVSVGSLSSAGSATYPVAQPGISVYRFAELHLESEQPVAVCERGRSGTRA